VQAHKVPLKRGVLLEGPYGTGKTLTAFVTAKKCVENGWTFIMLDRVAALKEALTFARMYAPAVVFAEDIDRSVEGERTVGLMTS
jgi:SpoVK/Ycf46/Vps4 family AAA+-type ATPase